MDFENFKKEIIGYIAREYHIQLGIDDPIFVAIAINNATLALYLDLLQKQYKESFKTTLIKIEQITKNYTDDAKTIAKKMVVETKNEFEVQSEIFLEHAKENILGTVQDSLNIYKKNFIDELSSVLSQANNESKRSSTYYHGTIFFTLINITFFIIYLFMR